MKSFSIKFWFLLALCVQLAACAKVGSPTGGLRDSLPPVALAFDPPLGATHFNQNGFQIHFDEFVKLGAYRQQLIVSPPLNYELGLKLRGKTLHVQWSDTLAPSTSYVVQFGESISDLNEGNVAASLVYAFSTGAVLDTGRVRFTLKDAWTGDAVAGARVMLFEQSAARSDSLPAGRPAFVGVSGEDGVCTVSYLPNRSFHVVALVDVDADFEVDPGERFAWLDGPVKSALGPDSTLISRSLYLDAPKGQTSSYTSGVRADSTGVLRLKLVDADLSEVKFEFLDGKGAGLIDGDSVLLASRGATKACVLHSGLRDTLDLFGPARPLKPTIASRPPAQLDARDTTTVRLRLTAPIEGLVDSLVQVEWAMGDDTLHRTGVRAWTPWTVDPLAMEDGVSSTVTFLPGALLGERVSSDTTALHWKAYQASHYGLLKVQRPFDDAATSVLWVLLDQHDVPVRWAPESAGTAGGSVAGEVVFDRLLPGRYTLVWVDDRNGDGRWTGASQVPMRHPERAVRANQAIEIRSDWEQTLIWESGEAIDGTAPVND